jgi:hypothetical protein
MLTRTAAWALIAGVAFAVPALGADANNLIGYTGVSRNGAAGVLVFHSDCAAAFPGTGARACTSADLIGGEVPTKPADPNTNTTNWVLPSFTVTVGTSVLDASGKLATPQNLSCDGWNSNVSSLTGLSVNENGRFTLSACSGARNIACCAPPTP